MRYPIVCTSLFMAPYPVGMAPCRCQAVVRARFAWRHIAVLEVRRMFAFDAGRGGTHGL